MDEQWPQYKPLVALLCTVYVLTGGFLKLVATDKHIAFSEKL
jgi:hypothetical protein